MPKEPTNDPIQEQLIAARKNQILDAAISVFAEKGYHIATIRDVAKAAGVADGTIYNYFENKPALLLGILNRMNETDRRNDDIAQSMTMDIGEFVRMYFKQRFDVVTNGGMEVFQVVLSEIMVNKDLRDQYYQQIIKPTFAISETYMQAAKDAGKVVAPDVQMTLKMISSVFLGLIILRLIGDEELEAKWDEVPELIAQFILNGIEPKGE